MKKPMFRPSVNKMSYNMKGLDTGQTQRDAWYGIFVINVMA